ncbi:MAG: asparagine synthetase B [Sphingobacteriales bacterium]|nr:MAG: asparagine synthetase B [Sphingobacteriales bacterium]
MNKYWSLLALSVVLALNAQAAKLFIPMDAETQQNHLKAYGVAYAALKGGLEVDWLLNYKGGSFSMDQNETMERSCKLKGVSYEIMSDAQYAGIVNQIANPDYNGDVIKLEKPPKIAVYTPAGKMPWDDAVTLVLEYAEIPYDKIYDDAVLDDKLHEYDWLHLHHEDFTGQYGKFWGAYRNAAWYQEDVRNNEAVAARRGFKKVSQMKLAVAQKIRGFVAGGGYLFAMCSATDSYDIALDADKTDICDVPFDGDPMAANAQQKLDYTQGFAFKDFKLSQSPYEYEFSDIDNTNLRRVLMENDYFTLFTFSAKFDPVPTMLCQNHTTTIKGFMGQTTSFRKEVMKTNVLVMGEYKPANEARYIHGEYGKGTWTFYGGHDPEDYQHAVGDPPTELSSHPTSPGYRLILNNVLFPAAKKKPRKT